MVIKFFSSTIKHPEPGGLSYVLKNTTAVVLRGNVEITRAVIQSSPANMAHRFSSGVLNDMAKLSSTVEEQLLDELEIQLFSVGAF